MVGSLVAERHGDGAGDIERVRLGLMWAFETLRPTPSDTPFQQGHTS